MLPAMLLLSLLLLTPAASAVSSFPPLSGPHAVGTTSLLLTDPGRTDALAPTPHTPRAFIVQLFYPTHNSTTAPLAQYMPPATASFYESAYSLPAGALTSLQAHSHANAPYAGPPTPPIVLLSPGHQSSRHLYTVLAEDLSSHGRVVLLTDHLYEADIATLPNGTSVLSTFPTNYTDADILGLQATRVADTRYALDHLCSLLRGLPGAPRRIAPGGIAMVGHSLGGSTAAAVLAADARVRGGVALDGKLWGSAATTALSQAFLLVGAAEHYRATYETWGSLWRVLRGWKRELHLSGARHLAFTDAAVLVEVLGMRAAAPEVVEGMVGVLDGVRAAEVVAVYVGAFVDMVVGRGAVARAGERRLERADAAYPEMEFVE